MSATTADYLETYLQDHRAGAAMGSDLAHRLVEENAGTPYEDFLLGLAQEIDSDVEMLERDSEYDFSIRRLSPTRICSRAKHCCLRRSGATTGSKSKSASPLSIERCLTRSSPFSRSSQTTIST